MVVDTSQENGQQNGQNHAEATKSITFHASLQTHQAFSRLAKPGQDLIHIGSNLVDARTWGKLPPPLWYCENAR